MTAILSNWRKVALAFGLLFALNAGAWAIAWLVFWAHPLLLGTALLAYTFGLRHAVDADHISAIDNVTRKLVGDGKRPVSVGLFFSLGHSTIVVLLTIAIAAGASEARQWLPALQSSGEVAGTIVSAIFLFAIAVINAIALVDVVRAFSKSRGDAREFPAPMPGGILGRLLWPLLRSVDSSWKMYPVGVLFGLGFDTATEVGLLGIAAIQAGNGLPVVDILIFPLLFTAGMSLVDTADGVLMLGAYGWAFVDPVRKLHYNVTVTMVSIFAAVIVGGVEMLGLLATHQKLSGGIWSAIGLANTHLGTAGYIIIGIFLAGWAASALINRVRAKSRIEANA